MNGSLQNLFANVPTHLTEELVDVLVSNEHVRIERIISTGQTSPNNFWYDQDEVEWVLLLKGEAKILFEGNDDLTSLLPGDHLTIAAHQRHRIEWTSLDEPTVWLAIFY